MRPALTVGHCSLKLLLVAMKSIFRSIASLGPWVRLLIKVGGCVSLAAFVLLWAPWRTQELWTVPTGRPATLSLLGLAAFVQGQILSQAEGRQAKKGDIRVYSLR